MHTFRGCAALESLSIPDGASRIGDLAFAGCTGLTVRAPAGSPAESYAREHGIAFEAA